MIYNFFDRAKEASLSKVKLQRPLSQTVFKGIDMDDIGKLEDLLRLVFIYEECGNLKVVVESLLEILTKRKSHTFYRPMDLNSLRDGRRRGDSSLSK